MRLNSFFAALVLFFSFLTFSFSQELLDIQGREDKEEIVSASSQVEEKQGTVEYGYIAWYGPKQQGMSTASGELYDPDALTGAHNVLPIGSYVRVTNLSNYKQVIIRINDRGPLKNNRILDVSKRAADLLGFTYVGVARAKLEVLDPDTVVAGDYLPKKTKPAVASGTTGRAKSSINSSTEKKTYPKKVSVKKYSKKSYTPKKIVRKAKAYRYPLYRVQVPGSRNKVYKIQLGAYSKLSQANSQRGIFAKKGIHSHINMIPKRNHYFLLMLEKEFKTYNSVKKEARELRRKGMDCFILSVRY